MIFGITANYLAPFTKVAVSQSSKVPANSHPGQGRHGVGRHQRRHSRRRRVVQGADRHGEHRTQRNACRAAKRIRASELSADFNHPTVLILLKIPSDCEFTRNAEPKRKAKRPLELGGNLRAYVYKINSLTTLITNRCRGICATSAYKKARVASDETVFCCLFRTLRLLSELRRRGASRGRPVRWFA